MTMVTFKTVSKRCFLFAKGKGDGRSHMKQLLGGKGANLCEMAHLGLEVPPGMTITTEACQAFQELDGQLPAGLWEEVMSTLKHVETDFGHPFAATDQVPLLLSVRSGAAISMPGMMDTVLNLGLNDVVVEALAKAATPRFAYDCYRRLLDMYADVVLGTSHSLFDSELAAVRTARGVQHDIDLSADDLKEVVQRYKAVYKQNGLVLPEDPLEQLREAICAVFRSWNTPRAIKYREINSITGLKGTAVNVQAMVYGNFNENSCTGVCFTRNPATGEGGIYGEFLVNAQGEDVVAGIRTPQPINEMAKTFPECFGQLNNTTRRLEKHLKDMQDCEFTVQDGRLFMLQTRNGKRTGNAALNIAVTMHEEGLLTRAEAVCKVEPRHLEQLLHPQFENPKAMAVHVLASGLAASPGAAVGRVVFTAGTAEEWHARGDPVILVRTETSPEDVGGMHAAQGILTARGGMTSHAAVVARGWGKPAVCGCTALTVDEAARTATVHRAAAADITLAEGDWLSLDGTTGTIHMGRQPLTEPALSGHLAVFMEWVDSSRRLRVLANADSAEDAAMARANGAEGVGLVRTEHMFFGSPERIAAVQTMIGAVQVDPSKAAPAIAEIEAFQAEDLQGIFAAMHGLPVTVRLLDPPLHEFLPKPGAVLSALTERLSRELGQPLDVVRRHLDALHEVNPMMGFRGCRLGIVHSEITAMQVSAIIRAALRARDEGAEVHPQIMVPLVGSITELTHQLRVIRDTAERAMAAHGCAALPYQVGAMIETPRACLVAGDLAKHCDFFSFGTNDLTQLTLGISRDDAEAHFLAYYARHALIHHDPFKRIDEVGVGALVRKAVAAGAAAHATLHVGVCGEHGGEPESIEFFNGVSGMQYVSCSPLRVPVARLAAAQAELRRPVDDEKRHVMWGT